MIEFVGPIEQQTLNNTYFRQVLFTAPHSQLVAMCLGWATPSWPTTDRQAAVGSPVLFSCLIVTGTVMLNLFSSFITQQVGLL